MKSFGIATGIVLVLIGMGIGMGLSAGMTGRAPALSRSDEAAVVVAPPAPRKTSLRVVPVTARVWFDSDGEVDSADITWTEVYSDGTSSTWTDQEASASGAVRLLGKAGLSAGQ